jgi:hypothetical protein
MECEGEKVYFKQGERCPVCNMYLVPIEEKLAKDPNHKPAYSSTNLPENFKDSIGKYYCPMFCEGDKIYDEKETALYAICIWKKLPKISQKMPNPTPIPTTTVTAMPPQSS